MSDALTDIARLDKLSKKWIDLTTAELSFLLYSSRKNLEDVYKSCFSLGECYSGYFGESGRHRANSTFSYYAKRFGVSGRATSLKLEDMAAFLSRLDKDERLEVLATFVDRKKDFNPNDLGHDSYIKYIKDRITASQIGSLEEESFIGRELVEGIFKNINLQFP